MSVKPAIGPAPTSGRARVAALHRKPGEIERQIRIRRSAHTGVAPVATGPRPQTHADCRRRDENRPCASPRRRSRVAHTGQGPRGLSAHAWEDRRRRTNPLWRVARSHAPSFSLLPLSNVGIRRIGARPLNRPTVFSVEENDQFGPTSGRPAFLERFCFGTFPFPFALRLRHGRRRGRPPPIRGSGRLSWVEPGRAWRESRHTAYPARCVSIPAMPGTASAQAWGQRR